MAMISQEHRSMIPLLLLLGHAAAVAAENKSEIISAFAQLPQSKSFYSIQYSSAGCNNGTASSSWVSMQGFLSGANSTAYHPTSETNATCAEASVCTVLFDPAADDRCPEDGTFVGEVNKGTGHVVLDYLNNTDDFTQCRPSGWYSNCHYEYESLAALKENPELLSNANPADLEAMKDFIYYVFYEDNECTDPASIWSSVDGEVVTVDIVSNYSEYSCAVRSSCAIDPKSKICEALRDGPDHTATFVSKTEVDENTGMQAVYGCDTSNAEVGQDECFVISPRDCIASSLVPGCHLRFFSAPTLATWPRVLIGDMSGVPEALGSSGSKSFSLECRFLYFIGISLALML